jgi:hypothetical protein
MHEDREKVKHVKYVPVKSQVTDVTLSKATGEVQLAGERKLDCGCPSYQSL